MTQYYPARMSPWLGKSMCVDIVTWLEIRSSLGQFIL